MPATVAAIGACQSDDVGRQPGLVGAPPRHLALRRAVLSERPHWHGAQTPAAHVECDRRIDAGARGLEVSPRRFLQDQLVQRQIRHRLAQPGILDLQLLQPLHLVELHAAILAPPTGSR